MGCNSLLEAVTTTLSFCVKHCGTPAIKLTLMLDGYSWEIRFLPIKPESGECSQIDAPLSFDEHPEFDKNIGDEIYSWLSLWADELADEN